MSSGSKQQTVGYRYYMGLLTGLCRGPIDAFKQINVGGKRAWPRPYIEGGNIECKAVNVETPNGRLASLVCANAPKVDVPEPPPMTVSGNGYIMAPTLFGGDDGEGGIVGPMVLMMGDQSQLPNPLIDNLVGPIRSALRGIVTLYYRGQVSAFNPYPKVWTFRVARSAKGWADNNVFYPAKVTINITGDHPDEGEVRNTINAMNPAHMIYECATNPDWGRGLPPTLLDTESFEYAADLLYNEKFGLCLPWSRQDQIGVFIQLVMDHIGGMIYVSRETGLVTIKLVRDDYDVDDLPVYEVGGKGGIVAISEDDDVSVTTLMNEVIVKYTDAVTGDDGMVRAQNIAGMQSAGSVLSKTVEYAGVPYAELANRLAQRDLRVSGTPLRRLTLTMNRQAWRLAPGMVMRIVDPTRRLTGQVFRVGKIVDAPGGLITVTVVQDIFGLAVKAMMGVVPPVAQPSRDPVPVTVQRAVEASYLDVYRATPAEDVAAISPDFTYLMLLGQRPNEFAINFNMYTGTASGGFSSKGTGDWAATATTTAAITKKSDSVTLTGVVDSALIVAGQAAIINNEYIRVDGWDPLTGILLFSRGVADTVPQAHASGSRVWFHYVGVGSELTPYSQGQTIGAKLLTNTSAGQLHPSLATEMTTTFVNRQNKPYPAGAVKVNDILYTKMGPMPSGLTLSWGGRNRLTQQDVLVAMHEAGVTAEASTTYTVRVKNAANTTTIRTVSGISTTSWQYTEALWNADGSPAEFILELETNRGGVLSYQFHSIPVRIISQTGWGKMWGKNWGKGLVGTYPSGGVACLIHGDGIDGGTLFPEYLGHGYLATGTAETRTDLGPFGTAWIRLTANSDVRYLGKTSGTTSEWDFNTGNKTAEARVLLSADSQECTILELVGIDDSYGWRLWVAANGSLNFGRRFTSGAGQTFATAAGTVTRGVAQHFAVSRVGTTTRLFINGVLLGTSSISIQSSSNATLASSTLSVGGPVGVGEMRIEEVRINTTTAYYTANFTPPSGPHADPV